MSLADSYCAGCNRPMITTDGPYHPSCDPSDPDRGVYRVSLGGKEAALAAVAKAHPEKMTRGIAIIRDAAERHPYISANEVRGALAAVGITGNAAGAVWSAAARKGLIKRDGLVKSDLPSTNDHEIKRWRSLVYKGRAVA